MQIPFLAMFLFCIAIEQKEQKKSSEWCLLFYATNQKSKSHHWLFDLIFNNQEFSFRFELNKNSFIFDLNKRQFHIWT